MMAVLNLILGVAVNIAMTSRDEMQAEIANRGHQHSQPICDFCSCAVSLSATQYAIIGAAQLQLCTTTQNAGLGKGIFYLCTRSACIVRQPSAEKLPL